MAPVSLTVLKSGNAWSLQVQDARGIRSLGQSTKRDDVEALALSVLADAQAHGEQVALRMGTNRQRQKMQR